MLPYGKQNITAEDLAAVTDALNSDWLTTGPLVSRFEEKFAELVGAKYAVALSNATGALHLAMMVLETGPGDRVVTSPNTFLASANCAAFVGATPDFVDIDEISYNLCPTSLAANWKADTKVVIAVDYAGQTADMPSIAEVARRNGAFVIEDACHAVGGEFEHLGDFYKVGGHKWADITTFSFHPVKTMTTGEGGMLVTDNPEFASRARLLRNHGMVREPSKFVSLGDSPLYEEGPWYYQMQDLGFNYRITDFQCALGLSQLEKLSGFLERRRQIVSMYNQAFDSLPRLKTPQLRNVSDCDVTSWHLYTVCLAFKAMQLSRTEFIAQLRAKGIGCQVLYHPVYLQPWYQASYGYAEGKCPKAEAFYLQALSLPLFPAMTDNDVEKVISGVHELCR